jgi:3-phenylpropionate/trans-cinnamate dioxygenase ferredoxin reductase component
MRLPRTHGVVTAAMNVNVWDVVDDLKGIVAAGRPVDPGRLADQDVALADMVTPPRNGA